MTMTEALVVAQRTNDIWGARDRDSYLTPRPALTAQEVVRAIVDQHPAEREIPALVAMVLAEIPQDHRSRQQALQQLIAAEIRRCISGAVATADEGMVVATDGDDDQAGEMKVTKRHAPWHGRATSVGSKWQDTAAVANDPLQALVFVAGAWLPWGSLSADHLRDLARADEQKATKLLERVVKLDQLAADMEAAGAPVLASLPDAAARIEGL